MPFDVFRRSANYSARLIRRPFLDYVTKLPSGILGRWKRFGADYPLSDFIR